MIDSNRHTEGRRASMTRSRVTQLGRVTFTVPARKQTAIVSNCAPRELSEPLHLLALTPHMHATGARAKVVLNRSSGEQTTLLDTAYDFEEQRTYRQPDVVMHRGDSLTTTCTYDKTTDAPIHSGKRAEDEMCVVLAWAWPAGLSAKRPAARRSFFGPREPGLSHALNCAIRRRRV